MGLFEKGLVFVEREELERWREAGKEVGRKLGVVQERERIIKLLSDYNEEVAIALIKGENK